MRDEQTAKQSGIKIISFAFRKGDVKPANITFDIRNIISSDSIYFGETGKEPRIQGLVRNYEEIITGLVQIIRATYKYTDSIVVAIGCTHGRHRSVALAEILKERMPDLPITVIHRDLK
jgi:UPF0042 nucleotide-binding protein